MIPFQAACWNDPEQLVRSEGFGLSVDPESQMAVFFADAERKDLHQMQEATDDILPLFLPRLPCPSAQFLYRQSYFIIPISYPSLASFSLNPAMALRKRMYRFPDSMIRRAPRVMKNAPAQK